MSSLGRTIGAIGVAATFLLLGPTASAFGQSLQDCLDQAETHDGVPPTCTQSGSGWVASWPDDSFESFASGFRALFVLAAIASIGLVIWKVSTARKLATQAGMDPGLATQMTLLSENGLDATYLASSLRTPATSAAEPAEQATTAKRLIELKALLDEGLINQAEYDKRRQVIIDAV